MTTVRVLSKKQLASLEEKYPGWKLNSKEDTLTREFSFDTFVTALAFCARIAVHAELLQHHPDILIRFNKVKLTLQTHDKKALTNLDTELVERLEGISG